MEKILDRVMKLLALAGNNPNEAEAAAAVAKAHEILAAHNLSMASVEAHKGKGQGTPEDMERGNMAHDTNFSEKYYGMIWKLVAELNYCKHFQDRPNPKKRQTFHNVIGRKINAIVASQMAMYLCTTMRRLAADAAKEAGRKDFAFTNAFLHGCSDRLCARLRAMRDEERRAKAEAQAQATSNALVLWSDNEDEANAAFIQSQMGITLKNLTVRSSKVDAGGYNKGREAGDRVSLNQQVGNSSTEAKRIS